MKLVIELDLEGTMPMSIVDTKATLCRSLHFGFVHYEFRRNFRCQSLYIPIDVHNTAFRCQTIVIVEGKRITLLLQAFGFNKDETDAKLTWITMTKKSMQQEMRS